MNQILDAAELFIEVSRRPVRKVPTLRGKTVINMFFEASTRTRTSFELAGKRLSADVVNISGSGSSVSKGESLLDTCKTLEAMRPDVVVIRHSASGAPQFVAKRVGCSVINGGDGAHEHPTQALLDAFAIRKAFGTLVGLEGRDLRRHHALARRAQQRRAAQAVRLGGALLRAAHADAAATSRRSASRSTTSSTPALDGVDVIMLLRIQRERLEGPLVPSLREYARKYGVSQRHLELASPRAIVMHPGPMNRGVEIHTALADSERSVILDQVEAGVAVRMAVLYLLAKELRAQTPTQAASDAG